jgi:hypothetical protein
MAEYQLVLRCPYCDEPFEVRPPDNWHSAYSFEEPLMSSFHGEVRKQTIACQNPKCKKNITIFWYAPMEYFDRM